MSQALLERIDPHLASVRIVARAFDRRKRSEGRALGKQLEQARFKLYEAVRDGDLELARSWFNTLVTAVAGVPEDDPQRQPLDNAMAALKEKLS